MGGPIKAPKLLQFTVFGQTPNREVCCHKLRTEKELKLRGRRIITTKTSFADPELVIKNQIGDFFCSSFFNLFFSCHEAGRLDGVRSIVSQKVRFLFISLYLCL